MADVAPTRGLYVHVPFCARACPYCDFDFEVGRSPDVPAYLAALEREAAGREDASEGQRFDTLYVGGGTPSLLGAAGVAALFAWIARRFPGSGELEVTVEVNPEHASEALLDALVAAGVTRISVGLQTFDPAGLRELGRLHRPDDAEAAIAGARARGLAVSADLIVGWRGQGEASLRADIARLLSAGARHASIYALTIEERSSWPRLVRRGLRVLPDVDHQAEMLEVAEAALTAGGLAHYEVASYAAAGAEARHNMLYWTWRDYVGLGPSAHSATFAADGSVARRGNPRGLDRWSAGGAPEIESLGPREAAVEGLWVGLRRLTGVRVADYLGRFPAVDRPFLERRCARQIARGNLEWADHGRVLRVAPGRWLWHDEIGADLLD